MKNKLLYLSLLACLSLRSQVITFPFSNAFSILFRNQVHVAGIKNNTLTVYRLNQQLLKTDSFVCSIGSVGEADLLRLNADTLHGFLNFYLQEKGGRQAEIVRLNNQMKEVCRVKNVDAARLNNQAMLGSRPAFRGLEAYCISSFADSTGRQFFLNKYKVTDTLQNFDYTRSWQFAFERRFIHDAVILDAGKRHVLIYVNLVKPDNSSQWLLKVNSETGKLIRGTKLNRKNEAHCYMPGICLRDTFSGDVTIVGQKLRKSQLDLSSGKFSAGDGQPALIYHCRMDSTGEMIAHNELNIPVNKTSEGASKKIPAYILSFCRLAEQPENLLAETDVFQSTEKPFCFRYANTISLFIGKSDPATVGGKIIINGNRQLSDHISNNDRHDLNGIICIENANQINHLFVTRPDLDVKLGYKKDENGNSVWLLKRSDIRAAGITTTLLHPQAKVYGITQGATLKKDTYPQIILNSNKTYLSASQINADEYQLKVYSW